MANGDATAAVGEAGMCRKQLLARCPLGQVETCSCGHVHLHVGPFTLRVEPHSFLVLAGMVAEAAERLEPEVERPPVPTTGTWGHA